MYANRGRVGTVWNFDSRMGVARRPWKGTFGFVVVEDDCMVGDLASRDD